MKVDEWLGISPGVFTLILILAAVFLFWIAELAEKKFGKPEITSEI
jgi:hypothetical protein